MIPDNQTLILKRNLGKDKYGEPLGFADFPLSARVINETTKTTNPAGAEVVTTMTVLVKKAVLESSGALGIQYDDRFSFTDDFGNVVAERAPKNIAPARGFSGKSPFVRVFI